MIEIETFKSVWDAIADTPEQAANLQARADVLVIGQDALPMSIESYTK